MKLAKKNQHFEFPDNRHWQPIHTPSILKNTSLFVVVWCGFQYLLYRVLAHLLLQPEQLGRKNLGEVVMMISLMLVGMIIHELVHMVAIPGFVFSPRIYLKQGWVMGCIPYLGFFYAGIRSRKQEQIMLMMPLLFISVIPAFLMYYYHISNWYVFIFIYLNACGCIKDLIITVSLFRYPHNSHIFMDHWCKGRR